MEPESPDSVGNEEAYIPGKRSDTLAGIIPKVDTLLETNSLTEFSKTLKSHDQYRDTIVRHQRQSRGPKDKFVEPVTSGQEYGWYVVLVLCLHVSVVVTLADLTHI
jgi:hypothetical protein